MVVSQRSDGGIDTAVHGARDRERAAGQALAVLSLDVDGSGYAAVGDRDPVIGRLQRELGFLRPVLFHSPYEAACSFLIGHRIRIVQGREIRRRMAEALGDAIEVDGGEVHAFPRPQRLLETTEFPGLNAEKIERLHGAARAALDGTLDRGQLRALPVADALASVRTLRGMGEFFALGVVLRGAGLVDEFAGDEITLAGIRRFYGLAEGDREGLAGVVEAWKPYRTWCSVLVHASERGSRS